MEVTSRGTIILSLILINCPEISFLSMEIKNLMVILRGCLKVERNMLINFWPIIKLFNFIKIGSRHLLLEDIVKYFKA